MINYGLLFADLNLIENKTGVSADPEVRWVTFMHQSPVLLLLVGVSLCHHHNRMTTRTPELWRIYTKIAKRFSRSRLKDPKF